MHGNNKKRNRVFVQITYAQTLFLLIENSHARGQRWWLLPDILFLTMHWNRLKRRERGLLFRIYVIKQNLKCLPNE